MCQINFSPIILFIMSEHLNQSLAISEPIITYPTFAVLSNSEASQNTMGSNHRTSTAHSISSENCGNHNFQDCNYGFWKSLQLRFILLALIMAWSISLQAEQSNRFERMDISDESDVSIVYSITQDNYGFLWAATEEGLVKYDSHKAHLFNEYVGLPETFSNKIRHVYVDDQGEIWTFEVEY